jgi:Cu(I)/Ag(I) efflux system membrane fusion protein
MKNSSSHIVTALIGILGGATLIFTLMHAGIIGSHDKAHPNYADSAALAQKAAKIMYNCPMHPEVIRDQPGTCPICGMNLVPMKDHDHGDSQPSDAIRIEASMIQSIGVKTVAVEESELQRSIRINATIAIDPQRIAVVNTRTMGWIESIPVGAEGLHVTAGQKLASFYSPELVAAEEDYLQALRVRDAALVSSARSRLEVLGVSAAIIDSIGKSGLSLRSVPIQAPISGVVLVKSIVQGQNVMPGVDLYRIADLSSVWAVGKTYPEDVSNLRTGMNALVFPQGKENAPRQGRLVFIAPVVDPETKTTEIRIDIKNTGNLDFKPGMNAEILFDVKLGKGVAIPTQAVIRTGERTVAIVALGKGYFAPRNLTLGAQLGDSVQVLSGLVAGDSLVTSAQFLIDSESNLKKAVEAFRRE